MTAEPCHGKAEENAPACEISGACSHETPAAVAAPPYVLPVPVAVYVEPRPAALTHGRLAVIGPGFLRIDSPPPRAL
jgi:hypothetical protein